MGKAELIMVYKRNFSVTEIIDQVKPTEIEKLLCELISIESHQDIDGYERDVTTFIQHYLQKENIEVELLPVLGERSNLIARLKGDGSGPVLVFNGHTDTIPAYDMKHAFCPQVKGDKIYGRGSTDMKGALAAMISVLIGIKRSGVPLKGDVVLVTTIGEESYSPGAYHLVNSGFRADYAIVGEPTGMRVGIAHKGVIWGEAEFIGHSAHGSVPEQGINAIYKACRWIEEIQRTYIPELKKRSHPLLGNPSINIGMIEGGTRPVIVPSRCIVRFERRMIPGENEDMVINELQQLIDNIAAHDPEMNGIVRIMPVFQGVPHVPMESAADSVLVQELCAAYEEEFGEPAQPCGLQYWTDGALLSQIPGIQTVVCGPGHIAQAHSNTEYISRHQLHAAYRMYMKVAINLCIKNKQEGR